MTESQILEIFVQPDVTQSISMISILSYDRCSVFFFRFSLSYYHEGSSGFFSYPAYVIDSVLPSYGNYCPKFRAWVCHLGRQSNFTVGVRFWVKMPAFILVKDGYVAPIAPSLAVLRSIFKKKGDSEFGWETILASYSEESKRILRIPFVLFYVLWS